MMDIIRDNIFLIILLFVGAISQWLKARADAKQSQEHEYDPADLEEMIEEAERRQSRPAVPPPLPPTAVPLPTGGTVAPAPSLRRKSREPEPAPALFDSSAELARQQQLAEKVKELKRTRGARAMNESVLPRKQSSAIPQTATGLTLKQRLGHRKELRQAFVLKEILEKPVGLR
ncbi:MAG: hypothetical protein RLZZ505_2601 [Verrucomicrobiota bacterium]|jgi:glycine/D-amino acid oxidase-like deaminating enzyme